MIDARLGVALNRMGEGTISSYVGDRDVSTSRIKQDTNKNNCSKHLSFFLGS